MYIMEELTVLLAREPIAKHSQGFVYLSFLGRLRVRVDNSCSLSRFEKTKDIELKLERRRGRASSRHSQSQRGNRSFIH